MPFFESISTGILANLIYDLAKKSYILFKGDFFDQLLDAFDEALEKSDVINKTIRNAYLDKLLIFISKKLPIRMEYTPEELAQALDRSEEFGYKLLGNFEIAILKRDELYKWVCNVYAKETIDVLKRILDNVEIIAKRFKLKGHDQIEEFAHISHLRRIKEKNIIPRTHFYDQIDNWFFNSNKAIMVLNGLGGMGKTIIAWEWKERLKQKVESTLLDKIFIWSFYDFHADFTNFVNTLLRDDFLKSQDSIKEWGLSSKANELLTLLNKQKTILILDGIEKELVAYKNISNELYDQSQIKGDRKLRLFKSAEFRKFIYELSILENCKTIITTRVIPEGFPDIEDPGYCHEISGSEILTVSEMEDDEIIAFVKAFDIHGTKHEILEIAKQWNNHPLSLRLLVNHLDYKHKKVPNYIPYIKDAPSLDKLETDRLKRVLKTISENTPEREKLLLMQMSAFRVYSINYPILTIFRQDESFAEFKQVIQNLYDLGLITCSADKGYKITDDTEVNIHPLIRHFFYEELKKTSYWMLTHNLLIDFFKAFLYDQNKYNTIFGHIYQTIMAKEGYKINSFNRLFPIIELYYHLLCTGKFDNALELFCDMLYKPLYRQFSNYNLIIELLEIIFLEKEKNVHNLIKPTRQGWYQAALANCYATCGETEKSVSAFLSALKIAEKMNEKINLAIGMKDLGCFGLLPGGKISATVAYLKKSIILAKKINSKYTEASSHHDFGRVLAYQGNLKVINSIKNSIKLTSEDELAKSISYWENPPKYQELSVSYGYRSLSLFFSARIISSNDKLELEFLNLNKQSIEYAQRT